MDFKQAAEALLRRIVPSAAARFRVGIIDAENGKDVFEIANEKEYILLRGNNAVSVASALNWYLKYYCHCQVSWNSDNLDLPAVLPPAEPGIRKVSPFRYRACFNYCTFSYSMPWWDWERWEREIDWMALHGVNLPLALTGLEAVWQGTLEKLGLSPEEISSFLAGPAFLSWQWLSNLEGWGGPLPQTWVNSHLELGRKILERERELGMTPIKQGFSGYVPLAVADHYPEARIYKRSWFNIGAGTAQLDPLDPLFETAGRIFLEEQDRLLGRDHFYAVDPFHEGVLPSKDPEYQERVGQGIFNVTRSLDRDAIIAMQTWSLHTGVLKGIPVDRSLMLGLTGSNWKKYEGFGGRPWVAGILHNYGGRVYMGGNLPHYAGNALSLLDNPGAGNLQGTGIFPEGIEHNPIVYELATEIAWHDHPPDLEQWVQEYARARYGSLPVEAAAAWNLLLKTVYGQKKVKIPSMESPVCARPALTMLRASMNGEMERDYPLPHLWEAWGLLLRCRELHGKETYQYDLVDTGRQCLADLALPLHKKITAAYEAADATALAGAGKQFIALLDDLDQLLGTRSEFLLGRWIADARSWGLNEEERALFEENARTLLTVWGPPHPGGLFFDYANRQWAGLVGGFYKIRWQKFIHFLLQQPAEPKYRYREKRSLKSFGRPGNDENAFYKSLSAWEHAWCRQTGSYPSSPTGNPEEISAALFEKWMPVASGLPGL
ncbi:alpha-N-acetylglucosaminidase [Anseongella ginsenosidimutans]|uniref:alpha-N-acetylglucosaminidase n=1 Tax=Anseongella ginsenosidimutans TaxID=496056 RepID=UPI0021CF2185|nr:alpha-N-acetylglucosaminidase [Anseongella ginsenosidimutans]